MKSHNARDPDDLVGRVKSLVRALDVLDELARSDGVRLGEVARRVALPASTVHRLLTTLEASKYVQFDRATRRWTIGVQASAVGAAFVPHEPRSAIVGETPA